jgi:gliding motility-associated-like protein
MYIDVVTVEKPTIKTDDDNVCKGSEVNITSNYSDGTITSNAQYEYKWYRTQNKTNWGAAYKTGVNSLEMPSVEEVGTWYYKLVVSIGACSEESDPLEIKVGEAIEFNVSATKSALCLDDDTYVNINDLDQSNTDLDSFQWFEGETPIGQADEASVNVKPETTGEHTYTAVVKTVSGCESKKSLTITVDPQITLTVSSDQDICVGELSDPITASGGESYEWTPELGANGQVSHSKAGEYGYEVKAIAGECEAKATVTINVHELPEISSITPKSAEETNVMVVTTDETKGTKPFEYSLDDSNYFDLPDGILENTPIGWNVLYIKDHYQCINSKKFFVEPTPIFPDKFFSPNGEGDERHEKWQVTNLESYDSYIVEIFDRHGKRLFIQRVGSFNTGGTNTVEGEYFEGWNGEYNGKPMPSDDYWYLITVEDIRKQYTGHFTLKR